MAKTLYSESKKNKIGMSIYDERGEGKNAYDIPKNQIELKPGMNPMPGGKLRTNSAGKPYVLQTTPKSRAKKAK